VAADAADGAGGAPGETSSQEFSRLEADLEAAMVTPPVSPSTGAEDGCAGHDEPVDAARASQTQS
jgi:hypothetical protein